MSNTEFSTEYRLRRLTGKSSSYQEFKKGVKKGLPIAFGYLPVSFAFGLIVVKGGLPVWVAVLISMTNLTSAGQFAGVGLIFAQAAYTEIAITTFVINLRYMLMSFSLSQKISEKMPRLKRGIMAFGITDETFAMASLEKEEITFPFMMGLISCPYWSWALGTGLGAMLTAYLPVNLQKAMGIALYAMFIALIVPAAKKSKAVLLVVIVAVFISSLFKFTPFLKELSTGWVIIIATILASAVGAMFFPRSEDEI